MLFPEEEKIIVEEIKSNGQTVIEERYGFVNERYKRNHKKMLKKKEKKYPTKMCFYDFVI